MVASGSMAGSSDHRPAAVEGPKRGDAEVLPLESRWPDNAPRLPDLPEYRAERGAVRRGLCAVRPPMSSARKGARVSLLMCPDQIRSHRMCVRASSSLMATVSERVRKKNAPPPPSASRTSRWRSECLLYTSDAADDLTRVDLGGRRI